MTHPPRDHGGGIDAAAAHYGGDRADWIDLSTGINPDPYPMPALAPDCWTALPDHGALDALLAAARAFWRVPDDAAILAAPGASALIAQIPYLWDKDVVSIPAPTYNEHAASFRMAGWEVADHLTTQARATVIVHPNNPDGLWHQPPETEIAIIDESFCDIDPDRSLIDQATRPGRIVLKSFGKFWGLAGLRLGFAIGDPAMIRALQDRLGPWSVAGPALTIGAAALQDLDWAEEAIEDLTEGAERLDQLMTTQNAQVVGGTPLFRLYDVENAAVWQDHLAKHHIWTRSFPYSDRWLRMGLPAPHHWPRVKAAIQAGPTA